MNKQKIIRLKNILKSNPSFFKKLFLLWNFNKDKKEYEGLPQNPKAIISENLLKPCLYDKTSTTPLDPVYFYQDSWCAEKVFQNKPKEHFDIGSKVEMLGIISRVIPVTMVDIRPLPFKIKGLNFIKGDILQLPFNNDKIESLSSICVIEHIGLGRYGDKIDPYGSEKSAKELIRVLTKGGNLYISFPIDNDNKIYFNAHRAFTREYILELFKPLKLIEEKYIYGNNLENQYQKEKGFGTGLFWFKKI